MANYEWDPAPPTTTQRVLAGAYNAILLVTAASGILGWGVFGEYDKQVGAAWMLVGLVLFFRFMPGVRRL